MNQPLRRNADLIASAHAGLSRPQKTLEAKWFYDEAGSALFEQITALPEYYPTRTEIAILRNQIDALAAFVPPGAALVELGSGASTKTRILLDHLTALASYIPLDISAAFLTETAKRIAAAYPDIDVLPVAADFLMPLSFPETHLSQPKIAFFPGSTIGNLEADAATELMAQVRRWPHVAGFILGVDLVKDTDRLIAAYDDAAGVTAAFNRNILRRLNREAGATIDCAGFDHQARWNAGASRIEMHLVARDTQTFLVDGAPFSMATDESIHTESSHKYSKESITAMARRSGWILERFLTDPAEDFAVCLLVP